jgi:carboxyl-terminal processing protease
MSRRNCHIALAWALLLLVIVSPTMAQVAQETMSASARAYLNAVLDLIQKNALHRASIDWTQVRRETFASANKAKATIDTYPAIAYALSRLQERHSFLDLPDRLPPVRKEAIKAQMKKDAGSPPPMSGSPFATRKEVEGHIDHRDGKTFAHLIVPKCIGPYTDDDKNAAYYQQFADKLHGVVADLQTQKPDGWIIDLRGNVGGNLYPMLAGIGSVVGEGDLGSFQSPGGKNETWYYQAGKAGTRSQGQDSVEARVVRPPFHLPELPWVAVLLDRSTASSGEAVAVSFAGRPRSRSFGEHTAGYTTANDGFPLSDGAVLYLATAVEAVGTGQRYDNGIDPAVKLAAPDSVPKEEQDAVVGAAESWLVQESSSPRR